MGIESVSELGGDRFKRSSTQGSDWKRTYTRAFQVITDDPTVGAQAVRQAIPVAIGQAYVTATESDLGAYANSIKADEDPQSDDGRQWVVTVEYGPYQPLQYPLNPLNEQPKIAFSHAVYQRVGYVDINGDPIVNSAGDYFDPPLMLDDNRLVMQITKNQAQYNPLLSKDFKDSTNSGTFFGLPPKTWKVSNLSGSRELNADIGFYWVVTYEFMMREDGWSEWLLDIGFNEINASGKKVRILDEKSLPVASPWPLNSDGTKKAAGDKAEEQEFLVYRETDFSLLGLDDFYAALAGATTGGLP